MAREIIRPQFPCKAEDSIVAVAGIVCGSGVEGAEVGLGDDIGRASTAAACSGNEDSHEQSNGANQENDFENGECSTI